MEMTFPLMGDCIGCESCVEVMPLIGGGTDSSEKVRNGRTATKARVLRVAKTEPPPPIPLLARTGNLQARMPWILRRHYTNDGRLILREERVRHHEYFRAHRSDGRLTLQLVPLEDTGFALPIVDPDDDETNVSNNSYCLHSKEEEEPEEEDIYHEQDEEEEEEQKLDDDDNKEQLVDSSGAIGGSGEWKCLYKTGSPSSSFMFGVPAVHSLGPVLG